MKDNQAFRDSAQGWWGKPPSTKGFATERGHAAQRVLFNEETSTQIKKTAQEIINQYFPDGRPTS